MYIGSPMGNDNDDKLVKIIGDKNKIGKALNKENEEHEKYEVFCTVDKLVRSARELYCEEDMSWDEMIDSLVEAVKKLKGKENELYDFEENESEDED